MNWILLIAALIVSWLIFTWLINVIKTTAATALTIALIALALQLTVGIGPQELWEQVKLIPQFALEQIQNFFDPNRQDENQQPESYYQSPPVQLDPTQKLVPSRLPRFVIDEPQMLESSQLYLARIGNQWPDTLMFGGTD